MLRILAAALFALLFVMSGGANAQQAVAINSCGSPPNSLDVGSPHVLYMDNTGVLCTSAGGGGGSSTPFTPNGNFGTLTATAASSASTALPAGATMAFQNTSTVDVSCVLSSGAATATTNKIVIRGGATVFVAVGSNVNTACINQSGSASNVVVLAGGTGLGTNFGGGGSGGGGGASDTSAALSGMTINNAATSIALVGTNSVGVLLSGTWVGTLTPEVSADGGTTWVATSFYNANTHATAATATANGTYQILGTGGMSNARVRISAYTSGTVTGNLKAVAQAPSANDAQSQILVNTTDGTDTAYAGSGTATVKGYFKGLYNAMTGAIPTGTNTIGKVGIDQTTPGTTNGVQVNAALPAGTNVLGKVSIDQTTPGTTNLVALAANQSVNLAQVGGVATPVGSGVQATAPRMTLATDSPGIVTLGATTKSASVPVAWATDQVGTAGTANASVVTVQGIASMTPLIANSTNGYPSGAIAETASATGTTLATTATLATAVGKTTYICGFSIRSVATAAAAGNATVTGTITGTLNFTHGTGATPTVIPNDQRFSPCIPASATNTSIAVVSPAAGTGGVMSVTAWGFQL